MSLRALVLHSQILLLVLKTSLTFSSHKTGQYDMNYKELSIIASPFPFKISNFTILNEYR